MVDRRTRFVYIKGVHKMCTERSVVKMELDTKIMGEKLVKLRGNKSQNEVAEALGISKSALAMYELGERIPRDSIKLKISEYYKKSIMYIFFNTKVHETCIEEITNETGEEDIDGGQT